MSYESLCFLLGLFTGFSWLLIPLEIFSSIWLFWAEGSLHRNAYVYWQKPWHPLNLVAKNTIPSNFLWLIQVRVSLWHVRGRVAGSFTRSWDKELIKERVVYLIFYRFTGSVHYFVLSLSSWACWNRACWNRHVTVPPIEIRWVLKKLFPPTCRSSTWRALMCSDFEALLFSAVAPASLVFFIIRVERKRRFLCSKNGQSYAGAYGLGKLVLIVHV